MLTEENQRTIWTVAGTLAKWLQDNPEDQDSGFDEFGMRALATAMLRCVKELVGAGILERHEDFELRTQVSITSCDGEWILDYDGTDPADLDDAERALLVVFSRATKEPDFTEELLDWARQQRKTETVH